MKNKKLIGVLILSFLMLRIVQAQQFQLLLDPLNPYQKQKLFNLSVINNSGFSGQFHLKATLKSRRGKVLMRQELKQNISANQSKSVRGAEINPTTSFIDADFNQIYTNSQELPPMNYVLCVEAYAVGDLSSRTEECIEYQASDFINISAVYPPSDETIYDLRPPFNWVNLSPNSGCNYDFRLVELKESQNKNAGIRRNTPIISLDGIEGNQVQFPADATPLKTGQDYAWQLNINCNGETVNKTDAFKFTYKEDEQYIDLPKNLSYVDITAIESGANLYAVGEFKFKYPSDIKNQLKAELYQIKKSKKRKLDLADGLFEVKLGVNKFELDLKDQVYLKHLKKYELLIKDTKNNRSYQMMITYVNPDFIK